MSPDRGRGAGQSLEDAAVLAASLAGGPTVEAALDRYDTERRPRTQAIARGARADGRRTTARAAHRALTTMIQLTPAFYGARESLRTAIPYGAGNRPACPAPTGPDIRDQC